MIETLPETGSTNADLASRLNAGLDVAEGDWLVADRQTSGRGRLGREWANGFGNFMGSTVVQLGSGDAPAHTLALVAGLAVHGAVSPYLADRSLLVIKWPNDLLLAGGKLTGILIERHGNAAVVGIGVNLASSPQVEGRPTAALGDFGPVPDRDVFADQLGSHFAEELSRWRLHGLKDVVSRWQDAAHPLGTQLRVNMPEGEYIEGEFAGLSDDGTLMLKMESGDIRKVHAGDVAICGGPG